MLDVSMFYDPYWNVRDQKYWCKMVGYGFPLTSVKLTFRKIIEQKRCNTFEAEYAAWQETQIEMQSTELI
ncbi:hypothetical protein [Ectobacillus antri]|uniref:hypothetical protein n=1 Tax=Ectobacillus antri TaxID=2486280 RepID=UPI000F5B40F5|nr:hypothetical protein [Ectobacillus antri]